MDASLREAVAKAFRQELAAGNRQPLTIRSERFADLVLALPQIAQVEEMRACLKDALEVLDIAEAYGLYEPGSLGEIDVRDSRDRARAVLAPPKPSDPMEEKP